MIFKKAYPYNLIDDLMLDEMPFHGLEENDLIQAVETMIHSLGDTYAVHKHIPKKMQDIIRLWYAENLTQKEIGEMYGISSSRVGQLKSRALRILRSKRAKEIKNITLNRFVEEVSKHMNSLGEYSIMSIGYDNNDDWVITLKKYGNEAEIKFPRHNKATLK
jgi:DNA-binding CsgD family transcriptional regulator